MTRVVRRRFVLLAVGFLCPTACPETFAQTSTKEKHQIAPTLDEIRIEGEIAMPQVVFITARDQFQYPDEAHRRYVLWASEIAALAPVPGLIWVVGHERPSTLFPGASSLDDRVVPLPSSLPESDRR